MPTKNTFIFESLFFEVLKISEMEQNVPKLWLHLWQSYNKNIIDRILRKEMYLSQYLIMVITLVSLTNCDSMYFLVNCDVTSGQHYYFVYICLSQ